MQGLLQRLSLGWHDRQKTGVVVSRLTSDIDSLQVALAVWSVDLCRRYQLPLAAAVARAMALTSAGRPQYTTVDATLFSSPRIEAGGGDPAPVNGTGPGTVGFFWFQDDE